jgi:uncharacterized protein with GYD domain
MLTGDSQVLADTVGIDLDATVRYGEAKNPFESMGVKFGRLLLARSSSGREDVPSIAGVDSHHHVNEVLIKNPRRNIRSIPNQ